MQNQPALQDAGKSAQVLPFPRKPKTKAPARPLAIVPPPGSRHGYSADDAFARYELDRDEPINERQRMLMNLIAVGIVVTLISVGVWLADTIQVSVKIQDCAMQGRTNCAPIEMPVRG
jgi:hypothetical protein